MSLETIHNPAREEAVLRILHKNNISPWARTYWARTYWARTYSGLMRAKHEAKVLSRRSS
tara:strand:+ start:264 stop:443 length:180 start_codon:yes stop_codon:yes gene_type:complete